MTAEEYENLPQEIKNIVDSWDDNKELYAECNRIQKEQFFPATISKIKKHGMKIIEVDRASFEKKLEGFEKQFIPKLFSQELYDSVRNYNK